MRKRGKHAARCGILRTHRGLDIANRTRTLPHYQIFEHAKAQALTTGIAMDCDLPYEEHFRLCGRDITGSKAHESAAGFGRHAGA